MTVKAVTKNAVSEKKGKAIKMIVPASAEPVKMKKKKSKKVKVDDTAAEEVVPASTEPVKTKKNKKVKMNGTATEEVLPASTEPVKMKSKNKKGKVTATEEVLPASTEPIKKKSKKGKRKHKKVKENGTATEEVLPASTEPIKKKTKREKGKNKNVEVNGTATEEVLPASTEPMKKETKGEKAENKVEKFGKHLTLSREASVKDELEEGSGISSQLLNQAIEGVRLLEQQRQSKTENKKDLLGDDGEDSVIYMQVALVKVADLLKRAKHLVRPVKVKVPLPNGLANSKTDVLLIAKDDEEMKDIRDDHTENLHKYQHKLRVCGAAPHISEVITLRQLKVEFKEYEAKRNLANRIDVVLCDDTIIRRIPMFLGKHFYSKRKFPLAVNLKAKNLLAEIERCLKVEILWLPMKGNSGIMKIGRLDQTNEMIVENLRAVIKKMQERIPGGWVNIQTLNLKTEKSKAVPFYARLRSANEVKKIKPQPLSKRPTVSGELTSAFGDIYTVHPDHNVEFSKRVSYSRNELEETREKAKKESGVVEDTSKTKKRKKGKKNTDGLEKLQNDESPNKKSKKTNGTTEVEGTEVTTKKDTGAVSEVQKKKKNKKQKKGKKAGMDLDSDDDQLEKLEKEYLKRLNTEKADKDAEKDQSDDEDDWAEASGGEEMEMSDFEDDDES